MGLTTKAGKLSSVTKKLAHQNNEKEKRAAELLIANKELALQNQAKEKRAAELIIANKELAFQNELLEFEKSDKEALINTTDDMMWSINNHFNIIAVNHSLVQHLEGLSGKRVKPGDNVLMPDFFSEEVVNFWKGIYSRALHGEIFKEEMHNPAFNNLPESWYETSFNPIYRDDIVVGCACYSRNITERKQTEHNLILSRNKIEANERRYRNLFEQNLAGVYQSGLTGRIINCNEAFAKMLKYDSPEELMKINASELYFSVEFRNNFIAQVIDQKKLYNYECALKCKDGSPVYVIENISLGKDIVTGEEFFDGILIDITDRKNMEETLLQNERKLKDAQATAHVGSWELDLETQVGLWSDETCRIYGISPGENKQTYQDWLSFIHSDDLEYVVASVNESGKTLSDSILNNRIVLRDGGIKHIYTKFKFVLDEDGNATGMYGITHDVTEAKTAENELKKLSIIASETINGVVICDKHEKIVWANNAFTKMYGYELNEVVGKNPGQLLRGAETDMEDVTYINEMILKKDPFSFEILNYKKNGEKIYIKVQVQFIFDDEGEIEQYFAIETDITRQRELEEKVELEKIIKQKQITNAVYAAQENERSEIGRELHDNVNQLLSATRLYIDMARSDKDSSDTLLSSASTYALNAIEEIRKLSKTLITPAIKEIGFTDLVNDLIKEIMLIHPLQILFTANDFINSAWNDKFQLNIYRIIQEQLNNILKHAHAEKIGINIRECENKILVFITDDGIGFDTTKRTGGVGITNIKSRSELFNGIVALTSEPGKGTSLSITFHKTELTQKDNIKAYKLN